MESSILNKFLLALSKTKDALLEDLENEYISIRKIAEGAAEDNPGSASEGLVAVETVINAVFERIGFDVSNYKETKELVNAVEAVFKLADGIADDVKAIADNPQDVSRISATVIDKVKDVISLIETFKSIKYDEIKREFADTPYEDVAKTLGRRLLDHILISLLRNIRGAFDDEIEYCRILARNINANISSLTSELKGNAASLLRDAEDRAYELAGRLGNEAEEIRKNVEGQDIDIANNNIYIKTARTLSCIYAVLDFLGLMGTVTVEFKVPAAVVNVIKKAKGYSDKAVAELGPIVDVIGLSPTTFDNIQKRLTAAGNAAALSYPLTIDIIKWERLKELFTEPLAYIKKMYQVDDYAEATELLTKIMALVRVFNPEVPDFSSIKNMLITLVRKIEDRVLTAAKEVMGDVWKKVEPFVLFVRMMIDLLEQVADKLKDGVKDLLTEYRSLLALVGKELEQAFRTKGKATGLSNADIQNVGKQLGDAWDKAKESATSAYTECQKAFGAINLAPYSSPDEAAIKSLVQAYADDLGKEIGKQIPASEVTACVKAIKEWYKSTTQDIRNFVNPGEWYKRFDAVAGELEEVFQQDVSAVTSLVSAKGAKKLAGNFSGTLKDTFSKIDISDYIKIITTAVDEVALPDPETYYNQFAAVAGKCFSTAGKVDVSALWKVTERKLLTPLLDYLKSLVINALSVLMNRFLTRMLAERGEEIKALRDFKSLVGDMKDVVTGNTEKAVTLASNSVAGAGQEVQVIIDKKLDGYKEYLSWISWTAIEIIRLSTQSPSLTNILKFLQNFYSKVPKAVKDEFFDLFPTMPSNGFTDYVQSISYTLDIDSRFFCATLLNLKGEEKGDVSKGSLTAILQMCIFVGDYNGSPALYFIPVVSTKGDLQFELGNNLLTLRLSADLNKVVQEAVGEPNVTFNLDFTDEAAEALPATGGEPLPEEVPHVNPDEDDEDTFRVYETEVLDCGEGGEAYKYEDYDPVSKSDVNAIGDHLNDLIYSLSQGHSLLDFYREHSGNSFATREDMLNDRKQWEELFNGKL